jgi:hypothetical protein
VPSDPTNEAEKNQAVIRNNSFALLFQLNNGNQFEPEYELFFTHHETDVNRDFSMIYDYFWHNGEFALTSRLYRSDSEGQKVSDPALYVAPCPLKMNMLLNGGKDRTAKPKIGDDPAWKPLPISCDGNAMVTGVTDGHLTKMVGSSLWALADFSVLDTQNIFSVSIYRLNGAIDLPFSWERLTFVEKIDAPKFTGPSGEKFHDHNWLRDV